MSVEVGDGAADLCLWDFTVGSLLEHWAAQVPDRTALVGQTTTDGDEVRLTYAELDRQARKAAAGILQHANPGDHVAILAQNVIEWTIVQMGAALAGVTLVAINPIFTVDELIYAIQHSQAVLLLHTSTSRSHDVAAVVAEAVPRCPDLRHVIALEDAGEWQATPTDLPEVDPDSPAMLQYTSGTTGKPKGALLTHRSMVNNGRFLFSSLNVPEGAVALSALPAFHTGGCICSTLGPLSVGGTIIMVDRFDPASILDQIARESVSYLVSVTTMLNDLIAEGARRGGRLPVIPWVTTGAANVPRVLLEQARELFQASVHNVYGQTEMSAVICLARPGTPDEDLLQTVGAPLPLTRLRLVDPLTEREVSPGEIGEVRAKGFGRMLGYYRDDESTRAAIDSDGWLRTGDLGFVNERGHLRITGRVKEMIIRGGENISPAEIESCLVEHPAVLEAVAVGLPDARLGEAVGAVIRLHRPTEPPPAEELRAHCARRLARFKVPVSFFLADEFPMTPSRKIQRYRVTAFAVGGEYPQLRMPMSTNGE